MMCVDVRLWWGKVRLRYSTVPAMGLHYYFVKVVYSNYSTTHYEYISMYLCRCMHVSYSLGAW